MSAVRIKRVSINDRRSGPLTNAARKLKASGLKSPNKGKFQRDGSRQVGGDRLPHNKSSREGENRRFAVRDRRTVGGGSRRDAWKIFDEREDGSRERRPSPGGRKRRPGQDSSSHFSGLDSGRLRPVWEINPQLNEGFRSSGGALGNPDVTVPAIHLPLNSVGFAPVNEAAPYYVVLSTDQLPGAQMQVPQASLPVSVVTQVGASQQVIDSTSFSESRAEARDSVRRDLWSNARGVPNYHDRDERFIPQDEPAARGGSSYSSRRDVMNSHDRDQRFIPQDESAVRGGNSYSSRRAYRGTSPIGEDAILRVPYCKACHEYIGREKDVEIHLKSETHFKNYSVMERRDFRNEQHEVSTKLSERKAHCGIDSSSGTSRSVEHFRQDRHSEFHEGEPSSSRVLRSREDPSRESLSSLRKEVEELAELRSRHHSDWESAAHSTSYTNEPRNYGQDEVSQRKSSVVFNAPKTISKDWGKTGNKRGDYGQPFEQGRHRYFYEEISKCRICGLKGTYDLSNHMRVAHSEYQYRP